MVGEPSHFGMIFSCAKKWARNNCNSTSQPNKITHDLRINYAHMKQFHNIVVEIVMRKAHSQHSHRTTMNKTRNENRIQTKAESKSRLLRIFELYEKFRYLLCICRKSKRLRFEFVIFFIKRSIEIGAKTRLLLFVTHVDVIRMCTSTNVHACSCQIIHMLSR